MTKIFLLFKIVQQKKFFSVLPAPEQACRIIAHGFRAVPGVAIPGCSFRTTAHGDVAVERDLPVASRRWACSTGYKPTLLQLFGLLQLQSIERKIL
jgi:hypothetical protein